MKKILMASAALLTMVASASAADLYAKAPVQFAPGYNWTGFYIGANAGYAGGDSVLGFNGAPLGGLGTTSLTTTSSGFIGGGQIGYNWQAQAILYGFEADIQAANVKSTSGLGALGGGGGLGLGDIGATTNYFGTVRARFGVMPWDRSLLYVTGGLAYGQTSTSFLLPLGDNTKIGWTVGAGLEYMIAPNWSVKTEYLYVDLGKDDVNLSALAALGGGLVPAGISLTEQSRMHVVRAGVNYHF
ncbi:outer membrane protein [Nitrobacter sp. JJSN]|uniref:outer membrane protein n=1 Tax=Nitrobacter sp. JJSN TaxID=3453033 RepID=UPI003F75E613